jgi:cysteinyl-tRNA synthetase
VNVATGKMARSEGTDITLQTIIDKGFSPLAYRYWLLGGHYRTPMTFTWETLEQAENAYTKLREAVAELDADEASQLSAAAEQYKTQIAQQVSDDMNTPEALATVWTLLKDSSITAAEKVAVIAEADTVLGLNLLTPDDIPPNVLAIVNKREEARKNKDWQASDTLRNEIETLGYTIKDTDRGPRVYKANRRG